MDLGILWYAFGVISVGGLLTGFVRARGAATALQSPTLRRIHAALPAIFLMTACTLAVGLENAVERQVTDALGWDFTRLVFALEGHLVERLQDALRTPALDWYFTLTYSAGAFALYHGPFWFAVLTGRVQAAFAIAAGMAFVWGVGLVGYLLLPVNEVWMTAEAPYHLTHVANVLFETLPQTRVEPKYLIALNNNFPSLHVAAVVAVTLGCREAREQLLFRLAAPVAASVVVATLYLGIHWVTDVVAGLGLAWAGSLVAGRAARRLRPERRVG